MKTTNSKKTYRHNPTARSPKDGQIPPLPPGAGSGGPMRGKSVQKIRGKKKKSGLEQMVTGGIVAASLSMTVSLTVYFRPFLSENVFPAVKTFCSHTADTVTDTLSNLFAAPAKAEEPAYPATDAAQETTAAVPDMQEEISYMDHSAELGNIADMSAEPVYPPQEDAIYSCILDTSLGPLIYYNQGDIRWKEYLYGGYDRLAKYGCGPVCVAMLINSFTATPVSPVEMADWSANNGYYARQGGSYHGLIPGSLSAFGLKVESVTQRTADNVRELLKNGHVLVALMGRGALTQNGHFIIIAQISPSGNVYIADPASYENSTKEWDLELLVSELKKSYDSGGPLWAVSLDASSDAAP